MIIDNCEKTRRTYLLASLMSHDLAEIRVTAMLGENKGISRWPMKQKASATCW